jgi:hypothetical protein
VVGIVFAIVVVLGLSVGALLKGRFMLGVFGLIFPPLSLVAVVRLAQPTSPWARWWYPADGRRMRRATVRAERRARRYRRWQDRIAGAPSVIGPGGPPSAEAEVGPGDAGAGEGPGDGSDAEPDAEAPPRGESVDVSAG